MRSGVQSGDLNEELWRSRADYITTVYPICGSDAYENIRPLSSTYITNHFNDKYSPNVVSKGNKMMHLNIVRCHAHILSIIQDKEDRRVAVTKGAHFLNMDLCTISPNCIKNVNFYVHFYPEWKLVHMILLLSATKMWYN